MVHPNAILSLSYGQFPLKMHSDSRNAHFFLWCKMLIFRLLPLGFQECLKILQLCEFYLKIITMFVSDSNGNYEH